MRAWLLIVGLCALSACGSLRPDIAKSIPPQPQSAPPPPALTDLLRGQPRNPANGGSAVVLLSARDDQSYVLCGVLQEKLSRRAPDDVVRPVYWPVLRATGGGCSDRLAAYDFPRAKIVRDKYQLAGAGPFLLVVDASGARASSLDLRGKSPAEVNALVDIFRDAFAYEKGIWDPAATARLRAGIGAQLTSRGFSDSVLAALAFAIAPSARAGCALSDARDAAC